MLDDFIRADSGITGQSMVGRDGLNDLIRLAKTAPRPFDIILIDDSSRLGRYLPDVLKVTDVLDNYGVSLYFAAQGLDSRQPGFRQIFTLHGMMNEQYVFGLRDKVHRGQRGRVLNGYVPGGKCYGYRNVPVEDPNRRGEYGRPAVIGVLQQIIPEEKAVIVRIFEMYAAGASYADIAKTLNAEGILSPQAPHKGKIRAWCPSAIREMLLNEKYRGVVVWNRTQTVRNRETGKTEQRPRLESEWVRVEVPELRIVSHELWQAAREQNRRVREKYGPKRLGGMNRTKTSRLYLFSSLLECGLCSANIVIVSGQAPNARYGCPNHRRRGVCKNSVTIPQRKLEQQLLAALSANLLDPRLEEERVQSFRTQLKATLDTDTRRAREAASQDSHLKDEHATLKKEQHNLVDAIAKHGFSPALSARLASVEARIVQIERLRNAGSAPKVPVFTIEEIREFFERKSQEFVKILAGDPAIAREQLRKRITKLVLTPKQTPDGSVFEVTGDVSLFQGNGDVMLTNSLEGIAQHYTALRISLAAVVLDPSFRVSE
ncbi:MAG: recombinase family protein [Acidobacteriia bacterium]|nr:recombinase family protein [Terriglobia bacterium]